MKNLKKIICVLLGAALLMSTLAPAAFAEDGYAGMNTDKVLAIEAFRNSVFPAETLCVALSGEYVSAGESIGISICTVGAEGQLETVHTYGGDEMLIQFPCAENGNRLELCLRSESVKEYSNCVLCIAEGSFMSAEGRNERIEYQLNITESSSMSLQLVSGNAVSDEISGSSPTYENNIYAQGSVVSAYFTDYWHDEITNCFFKNRGGITMTFDNEGVASASGDGSFTFSGVGKTKVTAKLNDFIYEEIEVESYPQSKAKLVLYLNNLLEAFELIWAGPIIFAIGGGIIALPLMPVVFLGSIPLFLFNFIAAVFGVPNMIY